MPLPDSDSPNPDPAPIEQASLWQDEQRQKQFQAWLEGISDRFSLDRASVRLASADASFRRYLRVNTKQGAFGPTLIIMDAPPDKENSQPFVQIATLLENAGIRSPQVLDWNEPHGFMLLTDLGSLTMMQVMDPKRPPPLDLYLQAVDALIAWQLASREGVLLPYDYALLRREIDLFPQWYLKEHRKVTLNAKQTKVMEDAFEAIIASNLRWPSVYVHRDFMPRNLMVADEAQSLGALGVLDFQDAVYGPITYDIASLMRDAFLSWDEDFCLDVTIRYWDKARKAGLPVGDDFGDFYRGVEWMGLQRHLKIAGIFARLTLRDGKPKYLADTPRFISYIRATCDRYIELKPLLRLIEDIEGIVQPINLAYPRLNNTD